MEKMMKIRLNGKLLNAFTWSDYTASPRQYSTGISGKLDGVDYEFPRTCGKGKGVFYNHYIWFTHDNALWMVQTGDEWPSDIYLLTSNIISEIGNRKIYDYLRDNKG